MKTKIFVPNTARKPTSIGGYLHSNPETIFSEKNKIATYEVPASPKQNLEQVWKKHSYLDPKMQIRIYGPNEGSILLSDWPKAIHKTSVSASHAKTVRVHRNVFDPLPVKLLAAEILDLDVASKMAESEIAELLIKEEKLISIEQFLLARQKSENDTKELEQENFYESLLTKSMFGELAFIEMNGRPILISFNIDADNDNEYYEIFTFGLSDILPHTLDVFIYST